MSDSDTDRAMAEELIGLIQDFQEALPVGSELIAIGSAPASDDETDEEARRKQALAHVAVWANRDVYNDAREEILRDMLAQVKVTLGSPGKDRREAIQRFKEVLKARTETLLDVALAHQDQGPSPIS